MKHFLLQAKVFSSRLAIAGLALLVLAGTAFAGTALTLAENKVAGVKIVVPPGSCKPVVFAARELRTFLQQATGAEFAITGQAPASEAAIVLGDCPESRAAGIDVSKLKRDGFQLLREGNRIFIAGRDDPDYDLDAFVEMEKVPPINGLGWNNALIRPEYATLFGVYDFLERVAGIRWYFPGKMGTYVPRSPVLTVEKLDLIENPAMMFRNSAGFGDRSHGKYKTWRMPDYPEIGVTRADSNLWALRCRQSTAYLPENHAIGMLHYYYRYYQNEKNRKEEYFAMNPDGTRYAESQHKCSLCYSNPDVAKQIIADAKVFFSGGKASEMENAPWNAVWVPNRAQGDYFSLLPNDHYGAGCHCERCKAMLQKSAPEATDPSLPGEDTFSPGRYSRIMWDHFRTVAEGTLEEFPNKYFTILAYSMWREMPENISKLPANLLLGLTAIPNGNSSDGAAMKRFFEDLREWRKYTDNGIWLWLYFINRPQYDGIPLLRLWAAGRFYNELKDLNVNGIYMECLVTNGFQAHLDIYLNHRLMWNPSLDANQIISEYAKNLYGAADGEVVAMLQLFEEKYLNGIVKNVPGSYAGAAYRDIVDIPEVRWPEDGIAGLRKEIYTDEVLAQILQLAQQAQSKVTLGTIEGDRLRLFLSRFAAPVLRKFNAMPQEGL
ncbi:MAG: DUF4838 domain-containing protein [Oligosphaeraceae bacterium]|nr:DUF4838 domain-containing protein [Oligosphaeraceae bacterium]